MKKNTYRILIAVNFLVILCTFLTGCRTEHQSEYEPRQGITQTERETLIGWREAYKTVIYDTLKECKEEYSDEANYGRYGLYDFDDDRVSELFLDIYNSTMLDCYIYVYDFNGDEAVYLDRIQSAHSWVYGTNKENAILVESVWMGVSVWNICELKNDEFVLKELESYYPDGFGDSIKPEENPLPGMGYEIKEIEYFELDDLSGISSSEGLKNDNH